jgi:hypothetical protein
MCTLIIGRDVLGPRTVVLAANRDEDPARPSDGPGVLNESPRVVGGRDRVARGTWLAVREGRAAVALLNRWQPERDRAGANPDPQTLRSRGLLALDVATAPAQPSAQPAAAEAAAGDPLALAALERAWVAVAAARYAPLSLVFASAPACWLMASDGENPPRVSAIAPGWHVLTHRDLDDPREPRAAHLVKRLGGVRPKDLGEAEARLVELLRSHGEDSTPEVCLHRGRIMTVSSSLIWFAEGERRYLHAEGPPCVNPYADHTPLASASEAGERT